MIFDYKKLLNSARAQLYMLAGASFVVCALILWQDFRFTALDQPIEILQPTALEKAYASHVNVGLHINSFPVFSFGKNDFIIEGIVWFKFDNGSESLSTIEQFTVQNSVLIENGTLIYQSAPIIKLLGDQVLVCYHIQASFHAKLNYKNFPLSNHRLDIGIQNKNVTPRELIFESSVEDLSLSESMVFDWVSKQKLVQTGYVKSELGPKSDSMSLSYPIAIFSIEFENIGFRHIFSLYFPLLVLYFIGLLSLLFDINDSTRLGYVATSLPILLLFRMVIDAESPGIGYSTHIDFVYYLLVFLSLVLLLFQVYVLQRCQGVKEAQPDLQEATYAKLENINNIVFFAQLLGLIVGMIAIAFR
jgi:hypothetical protein